MIIYLKYDDHVESVGEISLKKGLFQWSAIPYPFYQGQASHFNSTRRCGIKL